MGMKSLEQYRADFIDVIKRIMATNLTNKGTSASWTESLQSLANKIANVNTGKKFASGTTPVTTGGNAKLSVRGLSFRPSIVLIRASYPNSYDTSKTVSGLGIIVDAPYHITGYNVTIYGGSIAVRDVSTVTNLTTSYTTGVFDWSTSPTKIVNDGFDALFGNESIGQSFTCQWYAWE
jgi:hypothetical protein